ncbi:MAG: glycosyltransferase [Acutalibacteraceae bacterium]
MKKILFFIESLSRGGAEKVLSDIICNLDKTKFDITVCTVTDNDIYQKKVSQVCHYRSLLKTENYTAGGIRKIIFWLKRRFIYHFPPKLVYKIFFRRKFDIEVAFVEGVATKLIASSSNKKSRKIAWVHIDMEKNPYADSCYRSQKEHENTYCKFDQIVCVSQSVKDVFKDKFPSQSSVTVQYNPVDEAQIHKMASEPIELERPQGLLLGTIGRLEEQKGYIRLLDCVGKLFNNGYKFSLWIIGEGTQREALENIIIKYNMSDSVKLLGFQSNPFKYIEKCDAFVCSSYAEGFSTAATECLILEKPIFTVDCAGMKELFGGFDCGKITQNSDGTLYKMLEQLVSGEIDIDDHKAAVKARAKYFRMEDRMKEIERLLNGSVENEKDTVYA